jgi:hypothetical protein
MARFHLALLPFFASSFSGALFLPVSVASYPFPSALPTHFSSFVAYGVLPWSFFAFSSSGDWLPPLSSSLPLMKKNKIIKPPRWTMQRWIFCS